MCRCYRFMLLGSCFLATLLVLAPDDSKARRFAPVPTPKGGVIKVGILHSLTGTMARYEASLNKAEKMAIAEINAAGGVLGKKIEVVEEDPASRFTDVFPQKAKKLLVDDKVAVVFGCWTSVSRVNVLPLFEKSNGLLFYPLVCEGNECSHNVVYSGGLPNQQVLPAVDWLMSKQGGSKQRFYLLGSDYVFPRIANFIVKKYLASKGLKVIDEQYTMLGHTEYAAAVQKIKAAAPDVILSTIQGDSNINFYKELAAQGLTADKVPVVAFNVGEDELRSLQHVKGQLAAWNYFQNIKSPKNQRFVENYKKYCDDPDPVTNDAIESAYVSVYLWKAAVEKAGSFDVPKVQAAIQAGGIEFDGPGGKVKLDPKTQHTYKYFRMGKVRADGQFDILYSTAQPIEPEPYPQVAFPGWGCDWTKDGPMRGPRINFIAP